MFGKHSEVLTVVVISISPHGYQPNAQMVTKARNDLFDEPSTFRIEAWVHILTLYSSVYLSRHQMVKVITVVKLIYVYLLRECWRAFSEFDQKPERKHIIQNLLIYRSYRVLVYYCTHLAGQHQG